MEPCGTPEDRGTEKDGKLLIITEKLLLDKYDLNHCSTGP